MAEVAAPQIIRLSVEELERLLVELRALLPAATYQLVAGLLRTLQWVLGLLDEKTVTLARIRRLVGGDQTEKTSKLLGTARTPDQTQRPKTKRKGHGRKAAKDYPGAQGVSVPHPEHKAGQICPKCLRGKLYALKRPAMIIRIVAQPLLQATRFELERLRCALCGALFTAPPPPEAGESKYDPSVGVMLALMRYGAGLPMYRTAKWQSYFGVPLAPTTQWELIVAASQTPALIYDTLIGLAAQGQLLHNDDTFMRVQSLRQEITTAAREQPDPDQRTGIFTTGIVARVGEIRIALFFTGQPHAGENLAKVLQQRAPELTPPLQMCDGLSRNEPKAVTTLVANCLLHGRRQFVEIRENFPEECRKVLESLREVYRFDALTREQQLSEAQRLAFHQEHSRPVMDDLKKWMQEQLDQKRVEPNSGLGQAFNYMLKRWEALTRFLSVLGAPLDNNIAERTLKMAILHRKNSLSYKTLNGARVGDIHMSLIHTCALNQVNPFDYAMALQRHAAAALKNPSAWLPWNYHLAMAAAAGSG
jgi:transposase